MGNAIGWILLGGLVIAAGAATLKGHHNARHELIWTAIGGLATIAAFTYSVVTTEEERHRKTSSGGHETIKQAQEKINETVRAFYPASWPIYREIHPEAGLPLEADGRHLATGPIQGATALANHQVTQDVVHLLELLLRVRQVGYHCHASAWVANMLQWWQSPRLRREWAGMSQNYGKDVQRAAAILIQGADRIIAQRAAGKVPNYEAEAQRILTELG